MITNFLGSFSLNKSTMRLKFSNPNIVVNIQKKSKQKET
jgi:hypothetical protein